MIRQELEPGETLLWSGQPNPYRLFTGADVFLVPFSLLWGGFAIFWEASVLGTFRYGTGFPILFALFGIPFVALGLYFIAGRFWVKRYAKLRTVYAVTDRRVISLSIAFRKTVRSASLKRLPGLEISTGRDGSGTVTFGHFSGMSGFYENTGMEWLARTMGPRPMAFYDLDDARGVYRLVDERLNAS